MAVVDGAQVRIGPGSTLAGKYRLVREIGRGGVGVVYEAEHLKLRQRVAIKVLSRSVMDEPLVCARFDREARAMASLRSPYVTLVTDVDVLADGSPYMVMELLEGRDLQRELRERTSLPAGEAVQIGLLACRGLAAVHAAGIIHRDLKPSNLFLMKTESAAENDAASLTVKVMDFGVSKMQGDDVLVTHDGSTLGTPAYMAPEQVRSARDVDVRADIWSLGVILFRALAGTLPFEGEGITGMAVAIANDPVKSLAALRTDLPPGLVAVIERMLAKDPGERFATIEEAAMALAAYGDAPFAEEATDPNTTLPAHMEELSPNSDGPSHVRPTDGRRDESAGDGSEVSSPPPRSRLLLLVLPAAVLLLAAVASVVTALRVQPPPALPPVTASAAPIPAVDPTVQLAVELATSVTPSPSAAPAPSSAVAPALSSRPTRRHETKVPASPPASTPTTPAGLPPLL